MAQPREVVIEGGWLAPTATADIEQWRRDLPELAALQNKLDALFADWLRRVAPGLRWDPPGRRLVGPEGYDSFIPDEQAVRATRRQILMTLERTSGDWRQATLADLLDLGLELEAVRQRHANKITREMGEPRDPSSRTTDKLDRCAIEKAAGDESKR